MFFDPTYMIMVMLPALVLSGLAQLYLKSTYAKWGNTQNSSRVTGAQAASQIVHYAGLQTRITASPGGELSDHFDPTSNTVRLSGGVAQRPSVAAMAIAAHELGHAQQYQQKSPLIAARSFLLPAVQISPTLSYGLIIAGFLLGLTGLAWLGILLFGVSVVFMILTLPVEIDASRRGLRLLEQTGLTYSESDRNGARAVLTAAALTYVAAAVTSILTLLYYISLVQRRD